MMDQPIHESQRLRAKSASKKLEISYAISKFFKVVFRAAFLIGLGYVMLYPILIIFSNAFKVAWEAPVK